jgi:TrmH family RNA methyltransferase
MGSFCRVKVISSVFRDVLALAKSQKIQICGAFLNGENIYTVDLRRKTLLIMGNEGNGINSKIANNVDWKVSIPRFSDKSKGAESLNVSVATAVLCAEFQRQYNYSK